MRDDDIDRILAMNQQIVPSPGFVASVMDEVRHDAAMPLPIPFPWKRTLPGLSAAGIALASLLVTGVMLFQRPVTSALPAKLLSSISLVIAAGRAIGASWIALALVVSFASVKLSVRLVESKHSLV
jgi:hypothetical protein